MARRKRNPMSRTTQANGRKRGLPGNGLGAHQEVSPMGHATRTKSKVERRRAQDRLQKQRGWQ